MAAQFAPTAVQSTTLSRLKRGTALGILAGAMLLAADANAADNRLPTNGTIVGGTGNIGNPGNIGSFKNITQTSNKMVINWDRFDIGSDAWVNFIQTQGKNSIAVNRVLSGSSPTEILGRLTANGKVAVLDKNGVIFGPNSRVDVGGLIASTGDINVNDFMNGDGALALKNLGAADGKINIRNGAQISIADAGLAAFVAPTVINSGTITAKAGHVILAAANKNATVHVNTVDLYGDGLVEFSNQQLDGDLKVENNGEIDVSGTVLGTGRGGAVTLTSADASNIIDNVINMDGVIRANSVTSHGGKIVLGGGKQKVTVNGTIKADSLATKGGEIDIKGRNVIVGAGSEITANSFNEGGTINIIANNKASFAGKIEAIGLFGDGGRIETSGKDEIEFLNGFNIAAGNNGYWLIDPALLTVNSVLAGSVSGMLAGGSDVDLTGDVIDIASAISWNGAGDLGLNAANAINVNAAITSQTTAGGGNDGKITLNGGAIDINADISATEGDVAFNGTTIDFGANVTADDIAVGASGAVTQSAGGIIADTFGGTAASAILTSATNAIKEITGFTATTDDFALENTGDLATTGIVNANSGNVTLNTTGVLNVDNAVSGGALKTVELGGSAINLGGAVTGYNVDLNSSGAVTQIAALNASNLTGNVGSATLTNAGNNIANIGGFTTTGGDFKLADIDGLTVSGVVTSNGGDIDIATTGQLNLNNALTSGTGDTALQGTLIIMNSGNTINTHDLSLTSTAGPVIQDFSATIISTGTLTGSSAGSTSLLSSSNDFTKIGNYNANGGAFELNDIGGVEVTGDIATLGHTVEIGTTGNFDIATGGSINANGGNITLVNSGTFNSVDANSLTTGGTGTIELQQHNGGKIQNAIDAINNLGAGLNTLLVGAGNYKEQVTVSAMKLDLIGAGRGSTFVKAPNAMTSFAANGKNYYSIFTADNGAEVNVNGFTFDGGSTNTAFDANNILVGATFNGATGTFTDNRIRDLVKNPGTDGGFGFYAFNGSDVDFKQNIVRDYQSVGVKYDGATGDIRGNSITGAAGAIAHQQGLAVSNGSVVDIRNNNIFDNALGMAIDVGNLTVRNNTLTGNAYGIRVQGNAGNTFIDNDLKGAVMGYELTNADDTTIEGGMIEDFGTGIYAVGSDNLTLKNALLQNVGTGLALNISTGLKVIDSQIFGRNNGTGTGISLTNASNGAVIKSTSPFLTWIADFATGVSADDSDNTKVTAVEISGTNTAVKLHNAIDSKVLGNKITAVTGVHVTGNQSDDTVIRGNTMNATDAGIFIANGTDAKIGGTLAGQANTITTDGIAIRVGGAENTKIEGNTLTSATGAGRGVQIAGGALNTDVLGNTIDGFNIGVKLQGTSTDTLLNGNTYTGVRNGIDADGASDLRIFNETITGRNTNVGTGIIVSNSPSVKIGKLGNINTVSNFENGIDVSASNGASINRNDVHTIGETGISVSGSTGASVIKNTVTDTQDGIVLLGNDSTNVRGNVIDQAVVSGISILGGTGDNVLNNKISNVTGGNGIFADGATDLTIENNRVTDVSGAGISVANGLGFTDIVDNRTRRTGGDGIFASVVEQLKVAGNFIRRALGGHAINIENSDNITVTDNTAVNGFVDDGILITGGVGGLIKNNTVSGSTAAGIKVSGTEDMTLEDNTVDGNAIGIEVEDALDTVVRNHTIDATGGIGIKLSGSSDGSVLYANLISNGNQGILGEGTDLGGITLRQNVLTNNTVGARFESGAIDLRGRNGYNAFIGGQIGLQLAPAGPSSTLALISDTLGYTRFSNQSQYFVQLSNAAYYANGTSFIIDGQDAFYNGFSPALSRYGRGILTLPQLQAIEFRLFDLDDTLGLGQIFVGLVPGLSNEDAFPNGLGQFAGANGGFSVTIAGLPRVPGLNANGGFNASLLNRITPAAGGSSAEDLANISPAAGGDATTGEDVAMIEPAAGEDISCWSDISSSVGQQAVTYSFDNTTASMLSAGEGCGQ
jgi:filamentous hemagglutinin family protein